MSAGQGIDPRPAQAGLVVSGVTEYPHGIHAVDTHYVRPRLDASHLVVERGRAAFVDTGTALAVPHLLAALESLGLGPEAVDWIWLTHVHLDHAGGAGALLEQLPNARVAVHPRGAPHLVDPERLVAATRLVYGEAAFASLYGTVRPVPAARLVVTEDGDRLALAGREVTFLHTPGHALHHQALHDPAADAVFAGDTFGVSYRELDVGGRAFILPATTPSQFDPEQLKASVARIAALAPGAVFLTHYARVTGIARLAAELTAAIDRYAALTREHATGPDRAARLAASVYEFHSAGLDRHGYPADAAARHRLLDDDIALNVQGLLSWIDRRR